MKNEWSDLEMFDKDKAIERLCEQRKVLLEACKKALRLPYTNTYFEMDEITIELKAAIAKAEGKS